MSNNEFLTVSQLNGHIKDVLNMGFPSGVWVCGEIQGYNRNRDKSHVFFELCEKDAISKDVLARIGLVIFSGRKIYIDQVLKSAENAFSLKDDIEVKFLCKVDFYPPHGAVRLIVESIDPIYTLGKIAQEKQRLIALLKGKGTLDKNKQLPLPLVPLNLGLITSHDSAAYNDFISELQLSGYSFKVFCRNTLMQGKAASADVCKAMDQLQKIQSLDAIVITRGGGSIADLSCFDSQEIAEKIASARLPVFSGIGHEINITITDLAAHTYQKTPTAIAQLITGLVKNFLDTTRQKVETIVDSVSQGLTQEKRRLKNNAHSIQSSTNSFLKQHHLDLIRRQEYLKQKPRQFLKQAALKNASAQDILIKDVGGRFKTESLRIKNLHRLIELASPVKTLKRGFSITRLADGTLLRSIKQVNAGVALVSDLSDGQVKSTVIKGGRT
ncbi:MAG: exodeoxyribonuclease VII large subunit [Candidatus Omnitrophica bacterium]|nr:exodeoxyribonuclease VII large subunit [Candidatus Omnitrophota bacterium]